MGMFDRVTQYGVDPTGRGTGNMSALTIPRNAGVTHSSPAAQADELDPESHPATSGNPLTFLFIIIGTMIALFFIRKASSVLQTETLGLNWFNFFTVTTMAIGGILLSKAVFGRWNVPGVTNAVAAI